MFHGGPALTDTRRPLSHYEKYRAGTPTRICFLNGYIEACVYFMTGSLETHFYIGDWQQQVTRVQTSDMELIMAVGNAPDAGDILGHIVKTNV